jgi:hypothetical protein
MLETERELVFEEAMDLSSDYVMMMMMMMMTMTTTTF